MAKQQSGESKAPLVIALAFFVLTSIALGIIAYMAFEEKAQMVSVVKDEKDKAKIATQARSEDQERVLVYKAALGVATADELEKLKGAQNTDVVWKEYDKLLGPTGSLTTQLATITKDQARWAKEAKDMGIPDANAPNVNVAVKDVVKWAWPEGTKLDKDPEQTVLQGLVTAVGKQQLAAERLKVEQGALAQASKEAGDAAKLAQAAQKKFDDEAKKFPAQVAQVTTAAATQVATVRKGYDDLTNKQQVDVKAAKEETSAKTVKIDELQAQIDGLKQLVTKLEGQLETREDPFAFDKPHGKIIRRSGNTVTIDLGSADNLRAGTTFSVQPSDTPERGLATRMKPRLGPTGKPVYENGQPLVDIIPKGMIEVTEVLGPNVSQGRITAQGDPIRDAVLVGDVLYNSAWRRGSADHVALFGVFDVDGDGSDDIRQVVRDLSKMGVVVDAYFDLESKKWVGKVNEQTVYAIEGYYPVSFGGDALGAAKATLDQALRDARQQAREKGAKVVKMRDFFPRIGYKAKYDVPAERISQAFAKYLQTLPADAAPPPPAN